MKQKKILIVDDERGFTETLCEYLRGAGFEADAAHDFDQAVNVFKRKRPPVVLLDFNMPVVNGDKFLPVFQSIDPNVRVIVITGYTAMDVEEQFKGLGYFAFFEKGSLSLESLKKTVEEALAE